MEKKRIKTEPDAVAYAEYEDSYALGACSSDLNGDALLSFALEDYKSPLVATKHTSSPAQEATRARITSCETQLKKLYKLRGSGKLDSKSALHMRCLEDDLRKAHAKLRRLLNEAERQRRRRERLRCGLSSLSSSSSLVSSSSSLSPGKSTSSLIARGGCQGYRGLPRITAFGSHFSSETSDCHDDAVMASLRHCTRFDQFVRELGELGLALNRLDEDDDNNHVVYDVPEDGDSPAEGEVCVQVELLEGDAALEQQQSLVANGECDLQEIKSEPISPPSSPASPGLGRHSSREDASKSSDAEAETAKSPSRTQATTSSKSFATEYARKHAQCLKDWQEQYQEWYEKQIEAQHQWEETFMREQMELTKSMLENVTSTFLQGMQQVLQNVVSAASRRTLSPFVPAYQVRPSGHLDLNGLSSSDMPLFINAEVGTNGPTLLSTHSLSADH